ncbi:MAG: dienelactone hydrolase family protein [Verrucomicrobia bacterium]|nr:dienelactone hydrolase family protein [Verrucomicrobiota bacterium]
MYFPSSHSSDGKGGRRFAGTEQEGAAHRRPVQAVGISADEVTLAGDLIVPAHAEGLVIFAHGSGSSRHSPRNQAVARTIQDAGIATLLFDLLTGDEEEADADTGHLRFNIGLLALRLVHATRWVNSQARLRHLGLGYFGASTGGAAALMAAAELGALVQAVVSRGGRPDLAADFLPRVTSPTLLIVGEHDKDVAMLNADAYARLSCKKQLVTVPRATHLFEEPGALEKVAALAAAWFQHNLKAR